ncbi:hypothetical protein ACB092_01G205900 [Castanea dentata]
MSDFITVALSPSTTSSINPASIANSSAFRNVSTSASSLLATYGPLANKPAITFPILLRIMTLKPEEFVSAKTNASKFSLNVEPNSGLHVCTEAVVAGTASQSCASLYWSR